uniref:MSP domain-containing protein n=2 Tax=Araneus ventricosus TaxID=182803 RepID=A0A4Y2TB28_ARAVE|nr:hypothetical protein AVEN_17852-1 [Araneus ventricosus]
MKKINYSSLSASSDEKDNLLNEMREKQSNESLTLAVKPEQFRLPFVSRAKDTVVLENNNNYAVCFIVGSNSPETLEIEPRTGCIGPGKKAFITVKRPKIVIVTYKNENLIFKTKYCIICNSTDNYTIDSDHDRARLEENTFEKYNEDHYRISCQKPDSHHLYHSKKRHMKPKKSFEIISRNEINFTPTTNRDTLTIHPKLPQHSEILFSPNEFKSIDEEYFKSGLYEKETCDGNRSEEYKAMKNFAKCRFNQCSMPATERKCEKERFQSQCYKCFHGDHLSRYCCQYEDNGLSVGVECSNKNKFQQIEHCVRQKDRNICSGSMKKRSKTRNGGPSSHCKTSCKCKDNVCLQEKYSPKKTFQDHRYSDSKMRKRMKLGLQENEDETTERKELKNIPKSCKDHCKCSVCSKRNRKMPTIDASKKVKIKRVDIPSNVNEKGLFERNGLKGMFWCTAVILITFLAIFAISMFVVSRKEPNIPENQMHWDSFFSIAKIYRTVMNQEEDE